MLPQIGQIICNRSGTQIVTPKHSSQLRLVNSDRRLLKSKRTRDHHHRYSPSLYLGVEIFNYCYKKAFFKISTLDAHVQTDVLSFLFLHLESPKCGSSLLFPYIFRISQLLSPTPRHISLSASVSFSRYMHCVLWP